MISIIAALIAQIYLLPLGFIDYQEPTYYCANSMFNCCKRPSRTPTIDSVSPCQFTDPTGCTVLMYGDSVTELTRDYATSPVPNPSATPPHMENETHSKKIWDYLNGTATYRRFDSGAFTESGTWRTSGFVHTAEPADWNDRFQRPWITRYSTSDESAVSWAVSACETCSLIYRKSSGGTIATIDMIDGAEAEVMLGGSWVNADGAAFSFEAGGTEVYNTLHIRTTTPGRFVIRDVGSGRIQYWGLECYTSPPVRVKNVARSGQNIDQLFTYFNDDIVLHDPDHVIWNVPLINIVNDNWTPAYTYQRVTDMINAIGATGAEQIAIIPHYSTIHLGDPNAVAIYAQAEQALIDAGITYVDMRPIIVHATDLVDNSHQNDSGAQKYFDAIQPLLGNVCQGGQ